MLPLTSMQHHSSESALSTAEGKAALKLTLLRKTRPRSQTLTTEVVFTYRHDFKKFQAWWLTPVTQTLKRRGKSQQSIE